MLIFLSFALFLSVALFVLQAKDCGMKFNWSMFGMTSGDAQMLAECAKYSPKLASLTVTERSVRFA